MQRLRDQTVLAWNIGALVRLRNVKDHDFPRLADLLPDAAPAAEQSADEMIAIMDAWVAVSEDADG